MNIIKNIILLPFLPFRLAWKWSGSTAINGQQNIFAHLIGTVIIAAILYGVIGWGIRALVEIFSK